MSLITSQALSVNGLVRFEEKKEGTKAVLQLEDDASLVNRARDGELLAFRELVERYQNRAHAVALGVMGNYEDAQDVVQDSFLKAFRGLSVFRGQSSFYTWLYRIVFNMAIDTSRKRYRQLESLLGEQSALDRAATSSRSLPMNFMAEGMGAETRLRARELGDEIKAALEKLSPEHRAVIVLREIEGLSYDEISEIVGCSKGTVMSRLHHARLKLQKSLSKFARQNRQKDTVAKGDLVVGDAL